MGIETLTDGMIESAIEKLIDSVCLIDKKLCEYSSRGYCIIGITKAECSQNYHCCENYAGGIKQ